MRTAHHAAPHNRPPDRPPVRMTLPLSPLSTHLAACEHAPRPHRAASRLCCPETVLYAMEAGNSTVWSPVRVAQATKGQDALGSCHAKWRGVHEASHKPHITEGRTHTHTHVDPATLETVVVQRAAGQRGAGDDPRELRRTLRPARRAAQETAREMAAHLANAGSNLRKAQSAAMHTVQWHGLAWERA